MKKFRILIVLLTANLFSFAQTKYSAKDFFTAKEVVWYGIDYSKAKFIGSFGQFKDVGEISGNTLVNKYFEGWNKVVIREPQKYDFAKFLKKESFTNDLTAITKINSATKPDDIMQEDDYTLDVKVLSAMVKKYTGKQKEGLGVAFITESYNHTKEKASYYVIVFDIASKNILISEKYTEEPGGIGIQNYWISTAYRTLKDVSGDYSKWEKKYGK